MNDKNSGILSKISIEARTEVIKDLFADAVSLIDKSDAKLANLVEVLNQQKEAVGHGNWIPYLKENFGSDAAVKRVQYYMRKVDVSNSRIFNYLEDADSDSKATDLPLLESDITPRSERKTGQVEVVEPEEPDDDPSPDPPTHRKTAKGTEKVKEADKPKTAAITPEILDDDPKEGPTDAVEAYFDVVSPVQVVRDALTRITDDGVRVKEAKRIRKEMDKFDPPTKFTKPDLEDVSAYMHTLGDAIGRDVSSAADGFMDHYQSNGWMVGKVAMKDWRATARKWLKNQGEFSNGKGNGNGRRTTATQDSGSCLGANGRPEVKHRKINYK